MLRMASDCRSAATRLDSTRLDSNRIESNQSQSQPSPDQGEEFWRDGEWIPPLLPESVTADRGGFWVAATLLPFPPQLRKSMRELTSVRTPTKTGTNSFSVIIRSISGFWVPPLLFRLPAHFPFNLRASLQGDLWRTAIIKVPGDIWIMNIRTLQEILEIRNLEDRIWNFMR